VLVKQFRTGGDRNFGYLVADTIHRVAALVDPSYSPQQLIDYAREHNLEIKYVFNTHGHLDHTNGDATIQRVLGVRPLLYGHTDPQTGTTVEDGARFPLGDLEIEVIHTPGHSQDSICVHVDDAVFTGDTLFVGKVGGTDFGAGAQAEYQSLHQKLMTLPGDTRVYPGHDVGVATESTIAHERETNPFLLQPDFQAFVHLKRNWAAYKQEHGIA
jgi:hydroxyacylglutathione hydrolase